MVLAVWLPLKAPLKPSPYKSLSLSASSLHTAKEMMLKSVSLRQNYNSENSGFSGTVVVSAGDVDLRASLTDDISANTWPTLDSLSLSVEKPGSFTIDYDLPNKVLCYSLLYSSNKTVGL